MRKILSSLLLILILAVSVSAGQTDVPPGQVDVPPGAAQASSSNSISDLLLYLLGISWSG